MADNTTLHRNVVLTGLTSFFTDVSSEMIYPLLQAFVASVLSAHKALLGPVLGIIEGIAESTASLLKVFAGYYSDRIRMRKGPAIAGYALSACSKALFLLAALGWYFVLIARFLDRAGKGIRTAPRDAIISESTPKGMQGKAFGFQRALDFAGATLGVAVLYFVTLRFLDPETRTLRRISDFYTIFLISIVPAVLGVLCLFLVREPRPNATTTGATRPRPDLNFRKYDRNLQVFFAATLLFTLGNSSNQFLLLRSMDLGHALPSVVLMYMVFNLTTSILSRWFGALSDRIGRKQVLIWGYVVYGCVYAAFGFISPASKSMLWIFWIIYGIYYAMTEGVEKAFVAGCAPAASKATALGFFHTIVGIGLLPASILAGFLFSLAPAAPFLFGGATALCTVAVLALFVKQD
ncbi:MAG: MFS transporter [Chitinivibrionales bacterium]|nr:MFS transporter [Chitinivibrionales bacterium]MBD3397032.1 MFS transporter [Chitinivibrionales bacterium]